MAKAIHSMIRVLDEERSIAFYREAFGLDAETGEPYDLGNGYGHLAFSVEDIDAEHAQFRPPAMNADRNDPA